MKTAISAALLAASALASPASATDLVRVDSPHGVAETSDRLAAAVEKAGARIFARIDHAKGAESIGSPIPAAEVLLFGTPALGTPVIAEAPEAGLDLPLRVFVHDRNGQTVMVYRAPAAIAAAHGVADDHPAIAKMTGALGTLTAAAAAE